MVNSFTDKFPCNDELPYGNKEFQDILNKFDLFDSLPFQQNPIPYMSRPHIKNGKLISSSRIDFIFIPTLLSNLVKSHNSIYTSISEHKLIKCSLSYPLQPKVILWHEEKI